MKSLELKVPPLIIVTLTAVAMWLVSLITPSIEVQALIRVVTAVGISLVGGGFVLAGIISFRRARTTVNPMSPETASSLVDWGIYRITRNPMYVGFLLWLVAWAVFWASLWALCGPLFFTLYMTRFQIIPEERALAAMFGENYVVYKLRVPRWL
ncbi:MAG TPA: isoprenylcysteine carboxylmethyltransferase family protein [Leptolyngbyaceae cyanobacterium]